MIITPTKFIKQAKIVDELITKLEMIVVQHIWNTYYSEVKHSLGPIGMIKRCLKRLETFSDRDKQVMLDDINVKYDYALQLVRRILVASILVVEE
jgi:hypothetical protein